MHPSSTLNLGGYDVTSSQQNVIVHYWYRQHYSGHTVRQCHHNVIYTTKECASIGIVLKQYLFCSLVVSRVHNIKREGEYPIQMH